MNLNINKESWFSNEVYTSIIDEKICDEIVQLVNKEKEKWSEGLENVKALTSGWNGKRYERVNEIANFASNQILPTIGQSCGWKYNNWWCQEAWINAYSEGQDALPHCHSHVDYNAILIVKPVQDSLFFVNPLKMEGWTKPFMPDHEQKINEVTGLFVFFPSHLYHYVKKCPKDRISVAFNFINSAIKET